MEITYSSGRTTGRTICMPYTMHTRYNNFEQLLLIKII